MCSRPAVSTMTTSLPTALASASAPLARATGSISPAGSCTRTPACCATIASCWIAAGRRTSVETTIGWRPCFASHFASLPVVVVLPEPCSPSIKITRGRADGFLQPALRVAEQREQLIANDLDDLLRSGSRPFWTSSSIARSRTRSTNALTTLKLTSASSSARRISPSTLSTVASVRRVSPLSDWKTSWRRLLSASNIGPSSQLTDATQAPPRKPLSYMSFRGLVKRT